MDGIGQKYTLQQYSLLNTISEFDVTIMNTEVKNIVVTFKYQTDISLGRGDMLTVSVF